MQQQLFTFKTAEEDEPEEKKSRGSESAKEKTETETNKQAVPGTSEQKKPKIYTVSEIVGGAKHILEQAFSNVWVQGEVSGYKMHSSGHHYFTLKDSTSVLPAAMFRGAAGKLKFKIEDGLELICRGQISLYQRGGYYQLIVNYLEPKGVGELQLAFEQLKKKLQAEGLFDKEHKRPIPYLPKKIGVVTSPTGAAFRDILKVLKRRFPNIEVLLAPARVQGPGSVEDIVGGIELLNTRDDIDVMIVGRGGGSIEDLWSFNEEEVARAIYNSRVPVISAVGHEIDFTIADFVADFRAPTPSAAAEHAVPVKDELIVNLKRGKDHLVQGLIRSIKNRIDRLQDLKKRLVLPTRSFPEYYRYIDNLKERMIYSLQTIVNKKESIFRALAAELNHLSPLAILSKGYSVVTSKKHNGAIRSSKDLSKGDKLTIRFSSGSAEAGVLKKID